MTTCPGCTHDNNIATVKKEGWAKLESHLETCVRRADLERLRAKGCPGCDHDQDWFQIKKHGYSDFEDHIKTCSVRIRHDRKVKEDERLALEQNAIKRQWEENAAHMRRVIDSIESRARLGLL